MLRSRSPWVVSVLAFGSSLALGESSSATVPSTLHLEEATKTTLSWSENATKLSATSGDDVNADSSVFRSSLAMIIVTELGDKTFFIAALLAMKHARLPVFLGCYGALAAMTVLSAGIGLAMPSILSQQYTHWAATALFFYFGSKLLYEALEMLRSGSGAGVSDELEEVEESLKEEPSGKGIKHSGHLAKAAFPLAIATQALTLTFVAEWGDRSQVSTIALAAGKDPLSVTLGGLVGHACCTGLAVVGGRAFASKISERSMLAAGGLLFLAFGVHALFVGA